MKIRYLLVALMVMSLHFSSFVYGAESGNTQNVIYGQDLSDDVKESIEETGVTIQDDTRIIIVPVSSEDGTEAGQALLIKSKQGETIQDDIILLIEEDGSLAGLNSSEREGPSRDGQTVTFPPTSWNGKITVRGTAVYDYYGNSCYHPIGEYFYYTKRVSCSVSSIEVAFITDGIEYVRNGSTLTQTGAGEVVWTIDLIKTNPAVSTTYTKTKEYAANKGLDVCSGSPSVGRFMTFNFTVDGTTTNYTVTLS